MRRQDSTRITQTSNAHEPYTVYSVEPLRGWYKRPYPCSGHARSKTTTYVRCGTVWITALHGGAVSGKRALSQIRQHEASHHHEARPGFCGGAPPTCWSPRPPTCWVSWGPRAVGDHCHHLFRSRDGQAHGHYLFRRRRGDGHACNRHLQVRRRTFAPSRALVRISVPVSSSSGHLYLVLSGRLLQHPTV